MVGERKKQIADDPKESESEAKVLGMKKNTEKQGYLFYLRENMRESWVSRDYIVANCPIALIEFYETKIVFNDK